jgi:hypothetical protein
MQHFDRVFCRIGIRIGCRSWGACSKASSTKSARAERDTRQPTILRAKASITKATWTKPDQVVTEVKSLTHKAFGRGAWNCRFTRSRGPGAEASLSVVLILLPRTTPFRPHEPGDRASSDLDPFALHLPPDLSNPVDTEVRLEDTADRPAQFGVPAVSCRSALGIGPAGGVLVVRRRGDRQNAADRLDPKTSRCSAIKAFMAWIGGRAPPGQNTRWPCEGSRWLGAVPGPHARAP